MKEEKINKNFLISRWIQIASFSLESAETHELGERGREIERGVTHQYARDL